MLASDGYPGEIVKGAHIPQIATDADSHVYYAGVARGDDGLVANSVLLVLALACSFLIPKPQQEQR